MEIWSLSPQENSYAWWHLVQTNHDHGEKPTKIDNKVVPSIICLELLGRNDPLFTVFNVFATTPIVNKVFLNLIMLNSN